MKWKWKLSVSQKLIASFLAIIIVLAVNGVIGLDRMGRLTDNAHEISRVWLTNMKTINEINYLNEHLLSIQYKISSESEPLKQKLLEEDGEYTLTILEKKYAQYVSARNDMELSRNLQGEFKAYIALYRNVIRLASLDSTDEELDDALFDSEQSFGVMQSYINTIIRLNEEGAKAAEASSISIYKQGITYSAGGIIITTLIIIAILLYIRHTVSVPIKRSADVIAQVASGSLSVVIPKVRSSDEIGVLVQGLGTMVESLRTTLQGVKDASTSISASSEEMLAASEQNASSTEQASTMFREAAAGSQEQLHSFEEIGRSTEEMAQGTQRIAESSSHAAELSVRAAEQAQKGGETIEQAILTMGTIDNSVRSATEHVAQLESHMKDIGSIADLIGRISKQTNLLALNAAIEAARAGSAGRGFAVVAEEVRQLSTQTAESVSGIAAVIAKIKADTATTVETMAASRAETLKGLESVNAAGHSFKQISIASADVSGKIEEVAAAAEQLAASSEEVTANIEQLTSIASRTYSIAQAVAASADKQTASAEEIASAAGGLTDIAQDMNELVSKFKI